MNLKRYEPWSLLNQFQNEMNRMLDPRNSGGTNDDLATIAPSEWAPPVDIKEEANQYVIHADLPGVENKDVEVTMDKGILSIKGERQSETTDQRKGYRRVERAHGVFYRRFSLPDTADADRISARLNNGVLEVTVPKQERVQPRRINVQP